MLPFKSFRSLSVTMNKNLHLEFNVEIASRYFANKVNIRLRFVNAREPCHSGSICANFSYYFSSLAVYNIPCTCTPTQSLASCSAAARLDARIPWFPIVEAALATNPPASFFSAASAAAFAAAFAAVSAASFAAVSSTALAALPPGKRPKKNTSNGPKNPGSYTSRAFRAAAGFFRTIAIAIAAIATGRLKGFRYHCDQMREFKFDLWIFQMRRLLPLDLIIISHDKRCIGSPLETPGPYVCYRRIREKRAAR
jgi:hypothetical protein